MRTGVYLLEFATGKLYLGSTEDLDRRLEQHTKGLVHSTARLGQKPRVVGFLPTGSVTEARKLERKFKSWKNHRKVLLAMGGAAPTGVGVGPRFES